MNEYSFKINLDGADKIVTSMADANKEIKKLVATIVQAKEAGKDFSQEMQKIGQLTQMKQGFKEIQSGLVGMNRGLQGSQTTAANASMALLNLNYVIRDSPYFFQNFALGVLAVGNNLNPLIDSFGRAKKDAQALGITLTQSLKQALVGGAGISIAFSLVVTAIQAFVFWQAKAGKETDKTTTAIDKQKAALEKMTEVQLRDSRNAASKRMFELERQNPQGMRKVYDSESRTWTTRSMTPQERFGGAYGEYQEMEKKRQLYERELNTLGSLENIQRRMNLNESQRLKLREDNYKTFVAEATSLKDAQDIMQKWIDADKKLLSTTKERTKELKIQYRTLGAVYDNMYAKQMGGMESNETLFSGFQNSFQKKQSTAYNKYGVKVDDQRPVGKSGVEYIFNDIESQLSTLNTISNLLGDSLTSAFTKGKFALDEFISSLGIALSKMLLMKIINTALFGGLPVADMAGGSLFKIGNPNLGSNQRNNTINVQGKIYADKNKFVADIENARDYYNNNQKLVTIGRD